MKKSLPENCTAHRNARGEVEQLQYVHEQKGYGNNERESGTT